ncbi:protein rolling stone-like [Liolophura sinensis]|uniref:protein rolling stone-like n=1 Tax=Liolophura sinensis TaxID=3198878 RepID=UPI003159158F
MADSLRYIRNCDELNRRNFGLKYSQPDLFYKSQWPIPPVVYLLFRWATASYLAGVKIYTATFWHYGLHFIFLTNWTYLVLSVSFVFRAVTSTVFYVRSKKLDHTGEITQASHHIFSWRTSYAQWILYNVSTTASLLVTIAFWIAIYHGEPIQFVNFNVHAINSVIVLLDLAITAHPVRLYHVYQPVLYVLVYGLFYIIYWAAGGVDPHGNHYIYKVLDWGRNPGSAAGLSFGLVCLAVPLIHLFVFGLYKLRLYIHQRVYRPSTHTILPSKSSEVQLEVHDV